MGLPVSIPHYIREVKDGEATGEKEALGFFEKHPIGTRIECMDYSIVEVVGYVGDE